MTVATNLGFPRIGRRRELKTALERFWAGTLDEAGLLTEAARLRALHWRLQVGLGIALARGRLQDWQIWVNPDCGLKTRRWEEVRPALINLVQAARQLRSS